MDIIREGLSRREVAEEFINTPIEKANVAKTKRGVAEAGFIDTNIEKANLDRRGEFVGIRLWPYGDDERIGKLSERDGENRA